ncbi:Pkinase-domain-containing protein [Clavulina sp. PMI_390]|nr:Pkinase-domain-containing protein [Clavulina sp. PMI_390]
MDNAASPSHALSLGEGTSADGAINTSEAGASSKKRSKWDTEDQGADVERRSMAPKKKKPKKSHDIPQDSSPASGVASLSIRSASVTPLHPSSSTSDSPNRVEESGSPGSSHENLPSLPARRTRSMYVPQRNEYPTFTSCRSVYCYERLNHIEEGSYGVVFRAREKETGDIVAIKKLKLDEEKNGFPITSLREVMALMICKHENVVPIREIVVGDTLTQVFIVMDFIEHDLKSLLSIMRSPFLQSEIKTLLHQLLSATAHCHSNWVLHRDLKTSNLLMNNRGVMKVADFGLARKFGDPLGDMTQLVVTLWYRAPELLLGETSYSTAVDLWSVGCIFGELILNEPIFQAKGEMEMISMIFKLLGPPTEEIWPGFSSLPLVKTIVIPPPSPPALRQRFRFITEAGLDLLSRLLTYDPEERISAEEALHHPYFREAPLPKHPDLFGSFPSAAAGDKPRKHYDSPSAPQAQRRMAEYFTEFDDLVK